MNIKECKNSWSTKISLQFLEIIRNAIDYCKIYLELNWTKNCGTSIKGNGGNVPEITGTTFKITKTKLYVPIVTLLTNGNEKLTKLLNEGFKSI